LITNNRQPDSNYTEYITKFKITTNNRQPDSNYTEYITKFKITTNQTVIIQNILNVSRTTFVLIAFQYMCFIAHYSDITDMKLLENSMVNWYTEHVSRLYVGLLWFKCFVLYRIYYQVQDYYK
jgi:hypothetical protein